ncbi:MAG: histidine phosphatase family protein [Pseudomonadota bacterium]
MSYHPQSRRVFLASLLGLAALPALGIKPSLAMSSLLARMRGGGNVVYFRHGATTWSGIDQIDWPRERQRLLSDEGIRQSQVIGAAFRASGIPVGEVLASPFARCRDMAEIAFGRVEERMELMGLLSNDAGRAERAAFLHALLVGPPTDGTNSIIVSHRSNIETVAGVRLAEGEAVVVNSNGNGAFDVEQTLMPDEWRTIS